jgi:diguanylate cyclase (GGDEF)-like protein/PAS domain S-box-containing protein
MPDNTSSALRLARLQISLVLIVLLAMLWGAIALHLGQARHGARLDGEQSVARLAQAYGEQVTATVRAIDLSLLSLRDAWQRDPGQFTAAVLKQQDYLHHLFSVQLGVIDRNGRLAYSNLDPNPKPLDLSDREHFRAHANGGGDRLFISKPVLGRVSQKWSVQFTRPIFDAGGKFVGVMVVSIAPDYFSRFATSASLGSGGVFALVRVGGEYLGRFPEPERGLGKSISDVPFLDAGAQPSGVFARVSQADGAERLYAWHRLDEFGLVAVVGDTLAEMMTPYEQERSTYIIGGALLSALLCLLVAAMIQSLNLRTAAAAALEANESRYRTLVSALAEGVLLVDRDGGVVDANAAARAVFAGIGVEPVGTNLLGSALLITDVDGNLLAHDANPLLRALQERHTTRDLVIGLALPAKPPRWFRVSASPFAGGRGDSEAAVVSFSEVTEERLIQESQRLASAVIENAAEGVVVTDVTGKVQMVNPAFTAITGYQAGELLGQSLRQLRSGHHDTDFYAVMWGAIRQAGFWQGEIWNKRKNGEIYPEWLTISAVRDSTGTVRHFIGVFSDISERKQREHRIWRQANFDVLTDLPNRSYFNERLDQAIAHARRNSAALALLFIDLDHFKWVNDTLGHEAGNGLLRQAACRMSGCLRAEDTLARLSGDEFAVLLAAPVQADDADVVARKLLDILSSPYSIDERDVVITASVGIAMFPGDGEDGTTMLKNADVAMYRAKEGGATVPPTSRPVFMPVPRNACDSPPNCAGRWRSASSYCTFSRCWPPMVRCAVPRR